MKNNINMLIPVWIIALFFIFVILFIGKNLIVTILFTFLLTLIISGIYQSFYKRTSSKPISIILSIGIFIVFFTIVTFIITTQAQQFIEQDAEKISQGFVQFTSNLSSLPIDISSFDFQYFFEKLHISDLFTKFLKGLSSVLLGGATVIILFLFLLGEKGSFHKKMKKIFGDENEKKVALIYNEIFTEMNRFYVTRFFLALFNSFNSFVIMSLFGLEYALMFALIVFLMDFIPVVGGILSFSLPFLYGFVQFGDITTPVLMILAMNIPQFFSSQFLEPKIMGNRLNLSTFVVLISLIFWSSFWGIPGAFLAIPITVGLSIAFAQFPATKPFAILISKDGEV